MESKYNQLQLERYSKELANVLCDRYFATQHTLNGPQLISFTPVKQVNLFVIKELLLKWHAEMANLRSPYFDFEHEEVKEALIQFMNVLSRKIKMKREAFEPLLQKAIQDTLLVSLAPLAVFEEKFLRAQEEVQLAKLQENLKYIDIDKALFAGFLETLTPTDNDRGDIRNRFKVYLHAHDEQRRPLQDLIDQFNSLLPVTLTELTETAAPAAPVYAKPTPPAPEEEVDIVAPIHMAQREASVPAPAIRKPLTIADEEEEHVAPARPTLNDNFRKAPQASLADTHSNQRIDSLKNSISINQRFSFINELFDGDNMHYYQTIQALDTMPDETTAKQYVTAELATKYDWTKKQDHVNKLLRLIERKFGN